MKATRRLIEAIVIGAVAPLLLTAFVSSPALAAGNGTTVGSLQLTATFVNISVYANFSDDDNGNNTAILEWREAGGTWKPGMALTVDRRATIYDNLYYVMFNQEATHPNGIGPNPFYRQWRASVLGLAQNTTYEVRVTFSDPDGVTGTNPITATITTRSDSFPLGTGNTYYVATNGSDSNPGTEALPWATLGKAASTVVAGDTVYFKAGTYNNTSVVMTTSGTSSNYITFLNYGTDNVTFNGGNATDVIRLDGTRYVRVHGFTLTNAGMNGIRLVHAASYNVVEDCTIYDYGDGTVNSGGITVTLHSANNTIQYNYIYNTVNRTVGGIDQRHRNCGINIGTMSGLPNWDIWGPGEGNIYRYNRIHGNGDWATNPIGHGITGDEHDDIQCGFYKDCDVYGNEIWGVNGDAIGCESGDVNCRVWNNILYDSNTNFLGWGPCKIGPLFVYRNTCYWTGTTSQEICIKNGWGPTGPDPNSGDYGGVVYCYHNSFYVPRHVGTLNMGVANWGGAYARNQYFRNNVFYDTRWCVLQNLAAYYNDFDYDCVYNEGNTEFWIWGSTNYQNIAAVRSALGLEMHGISANPLFVAPASGDLSLQPTSPCIDKGVLLPGFNDANSPWPYKGSAPDMGCFEYPTYRLSVDVTPPGTTIIRGNGWYIDGTLVSIGPALGTIQSGVGTRYAFSRWIVDGVERTGNPISIIMDSPHKVTARYETQYHLSVDSEYDGLSGTGWYTVGTAVSVSPAPEAIPGITGTRYAFSRWIVDDVERTGNPISITMDSPHQAVAQYETQYYLKVDSKYGNPQGSGWYFSDSTAEFSVPATVGVIIQHHFTGWSGDSTAATPAASIIMDGPKTLTANWRSDYSRLCIVIGILAVFIGVTSIFVARRRKKLPSS